MASNTGHTIIGFAILVMVLTMVSALAFAYVALFQLMRPLDAALLLLVCAGTAGWLIKYLMPNKE